MNENKISVTVTADAAKKIADAILVIRQQLPVLIQLSADERHEMPKMGDKTLAFVTKALEMAKQNTTLVPTYIQLAEFEKDVLAATAYSKVFQSLKQLSDNVEDTAMLAGSEAYQQALVFYNAVKQATKTGVAGSKTIYEELSARFPTRHLKQTEVK